MKAVLVQKTGTPDVLEYTDRDRPEIEGGRVLVRVAAAGLNFIDTYKRSGKYPMELPFVPGEEGAGTVEVVGSGATRFRPGDRVAWAIAKGSYAEYAAVEERHLVRVPDGVDLRVAAAVILQGMTAHYLSHDTFPLAPGNTALVLAAAGGVGALLVQMAKLRGARVIGTVSTDEKARIAKEAGADEVIDYSRLDFAKEVRRLTGGEGVDVVYDSVGKDTFDRSLDSLRPRGFLVLFGQSSGAVAPIDPQVLNRKGSVFLTRPNLVHYTLDREELERRAGDLFGWIRDGKLTVRIDREFPLRDAAEAHRYIEGRKTKGKVLLIP